MVLAGRSGRAAARRGRAAIRRRGARTRDLARLVRRPRRSGVGTTRPPGRVARTDRRAGQQRRRHGAAVPPHRRRLRVADGDQPLRAVPADRAAAAPAGRERRRPGGDGVVADAPHRPAGAAGRPARSRTALLGAGRSTPGPSWPTCCSPSSSTAGCVGPGCRSRRWPRTRASPAPTWWSTASSAARPAVVASILDARDQGRRRSRPPTGALPTLMAATADLPGATYCGPSGFQQQRGAPTVVGCTRAGARRGRAAAAVGDQRAGRGSGLALSRSGGLSADAGRTAGRPSRRQPHGPPSRCARRAGTPARTARGRRCAAGWPSTCR